jgi:hypothetical protein
MNFIWEWWDGLYKPSHILSKKYFSFRKWRKMEITPITQPQYSLFGKIRLVNFNFIWYNDTDQIKGIDLYLINIREIGESRWGN